MYSQDLINEIKEVYPDFPELHERAEKGSIWVGRILQDSIPNGITPEEIMAATDLEELKNKARIIKRKEKLYRKWLKEDPNNIDIL